jgi:hypothetical protein
MAATPIPPSIDELARFFHLSEDDQALGPVTVSGPALVRSLERLQDVRDLEIPLPATVHVAPTRLASLARFAVAAKVTSISRLQTARRLGEVLDLVHQASGPIGFDFARLACCRAARAL